MCHIYCQHTTSITPIVPRNCFAVSPGKSTVQSAVMTASGSGSYNGHNCRESDMSVFPTHILQHIIITTLGRNIEVWCEYGVAGYGINDSLRHIEIHAKIYQSKTAINRLLVNK